MNKKNLKIIENQNCDMCNKKTSTLITQIINDPYCGDLSIFTMNCKNCKYKKSDVGFLNPKKPAKYILEVENEKDLNIRIVKSSNCDLIIPTFGLDVESGLLSDGFISNIEGVLHKFKTQLNHFENEKTEKLKKNLDLAIKGKKKFKLILKDNSGNSTIISDKVKIEKL